MECILLTPGSKYVTFACQRGSYVCKIIRQVQGNDDDSKSCQGRSRFFNITPKTINIWDINQLNGRVNYYQIYFDSFKSWLTPHERLFCQVNYYGIGRAFHYFFKKGKLGHVSYVNFMIDACNELVIVGMGDRDHVTRHG